MRRWKSGMLGLLLLGIGYGLGASGLLEARRLTAQDVGIGVTEPTQEKIQTAHTALLDAADALRAEGRYETATEEVNAFLVLSGGGNALADLETGRGVDPETFAALYAGQAVPEVQELLDFNDDGLLTYNGQIVRMYSRSRLRTAFAERLALTEGGR